ncbi:hypothetical protein NPS58_03860 [Pseudomonas putida]|uniref:hypothetical protein n=1 Tax=Pseudomonas putida TaxID=303 RepID=UPI00236401FF|nr:hypothetical protein [Pseudomonas putida]MDD2056581.1 hypothetical protein [Pseudomonas putida]
MGRAVTVALEPLLKAGCTLNAVTEEDGGQWLKVTLPDGRHIGSWCLDCLNFDCRSIHSSGNAWMEEWLIGNNVPYVHG